jgi:hypothetical protein
MAVYLYRCEEGGGMVLGFDGDPPAWATCPKCAGAAECGRCDGMQLVPGIAPEPAEPLRTLTYRCPGGHVRAVSFVDKAQPESLACRECDGMLRA